MAIKSFFKRQSRAQIASLVGAGILIAAILGGNEFALRTLRNATLDTTATNLKSQATVLVSEVDRSLKALDLSLSFLSDHIARLGVRDGATLQREMAGEDFHRLLREMQAGLTHIAALTLMSDQGQLINFSRSWPVPNVNVADRDYFGALKNDASLASFISAPVKNRATGTWTVYLAHRLNSADGGFIGLLLGAIELESYESYFQSIALQEGSAINLVREDGVLLARYPKSDLVGKVVRTVSDPARTAVPIAMRVISPFDGQERIIAAAKLANFKMGIIVSQTVDGALRDWRSFAVLSYAMAVGSSWLLLAVLFLLMRWWRSQERLSDQLSLQNARFDAALSNMSQGLCLFDANKDLVIANSRFREMYNLPEELVRPGTSLTQMLQYLGARGEKDGLTVDEHVQKIPTHVRQNFTPADGREISIRRKPMADGSQPMKTSPSGNARSGYWLIKPLNSSG